MKTLLLAWLTAAGVGAWVPASSGAQPETTATSPETGSQLDQVRFGLISQTTKLIGARVRDRNASRIGHMQDIYVDLSTGEAVAALCSLRANDQLMLVPARGFWTATGNKIMLVDYKRHLKEAPCITRTELRLGLEPDCLKRAFSFFRQELPPMSAADPGRLVSAAGLVQRQLVSQSGEPLGEVADIAVDLPVGRAVYLLVQPANDAAAPGVLYAVPPQVVSREPAKDALVLKADRACFLAGPRFAKEFMTELCRPELAASVERHYGILAKATVASPRTDQEIVQAIVAEIVRSDRFYSSRDVKITATKGRVKLAIGVKNEKRKQLLVAAAARVVGATNVEAEVDLPAKP